VFDWLCEGRSSVYAVLALAGVILLVLWWQTRKRSVLLVCGAIVLLAGLHFFLDRFVETDHEQVIRKLQEMAAGVKQRNADAILTHVSDRFQLGSMGKPELRGYVEQALQHGWVDDLAVWDIMFPPSELGPSATSNVAPGKLLFVQFRAKPTGAMTGATAYYLCRAHFIRDADGQWRLHDFQVFNPFVDTDKPLPLPRL
jgi:hypothetical protein